MRVRIAECSRQTGMPIGLLSLNVIFAHHRRVWGKMDESDLQNISKRGLEVVEEI